MAMIFISYSSEDRDIVHLIEPQMERIFGAEIAWYDKSDDGIKGGELWWNRILGEIRNCQIFVFLMSNEAAKSEWCRRELEEALLLNKTVIPVFLETYTSEDYPVEFTGDLKAKLKELQYVDFRGGDSCYPYSDLSELWGAINRAQRMQLTLTERWVLYNQYEIIKLLRVDERFEKKYQEWDETPEQEVLLHGYERHYPLMGLVELFKNPMSYNDGEEVIQILEMFWRIDNALRDVGRNETAVEVSNADLEHLKFSSFQESLEHKQFSYMDLLKRERRFEKIMPKSVDPSSPMEMLPIYRNMLKAWRKSPDENMLSQEDLVRIAEAARERPLYPYYD